MKPQPYPFRIVNDELGIPPVDLDALAASFADLGRPLRILGLGAGVQSTRLALMPIYDELEAFDAVIFADTGWEPAAVYTHLIKLAAAIVAHGTPVIAATAGNIRDDHANPTGDHLFIRNPRKHPEYLGRQRTFMPFFITAPEGGYLYRGEDTALDSRSKDGRTRRTCTKTYKIEVVDKATQRLLGLRPGQRWPTRHAVTHTMGISWDESQRVADPSRPSFRHAYPLVDRRITRDQCEAWNTAHGWPDVPRSACIGCPFRRDDEWRHLRDTSPDEFGDAVDFDRTFRARQAAGLTPIEGTPYLHDSRVPLAEADIERDLKTPDRLQLSLFDASCEGFCGT